MRGGGIACRCPDCESGYIMGGPLWSDPLHDPEFVAGLLQDLERDKARWGEAACLPYLYEHTPGHAWPLLVMCSYAQYAKVRGLLSCVAEELHDIPLWVCSDCHVSCCFIPVVVRTAHCTLVQHRTLQLFYAWQ